MKKRSILISALFLAVVCAVSAQDTPRLAILPFTGNNTRDAENITELFSFEPDITENFTVVPRTDAIENIMKEQEFQLSGLTDSDTISELGRRMNADYVLAGHITALGPSKLLLITIVHVEELRQIAGDYREYTHIEETEAFLPEMAKRIAEASRRDTARLPRLAVLPFNVQTSGVNEGDAEVLAQILATDITNSGKYAVFPRTKAVETVMKEHNIERSGMTDPDNIQRIGAAVNAQYMLSANFRSLGSNKYFSAAILDTEHANQTEGNRKQYQSISDGLTLMAELSAQIVDPTSKPYIPKPPRKPITIEPMVYFSVLNIGFGSETGLSLEWGLQIGPRVDRFDLFVDINGGVTGNETGNNSQVFVYHAGAAMEYRFAGLSAGIGGGLFNTNIESNYQFPYIRGSFSVFLADNWSKLGLYYDYSFEHGSMFGIRWHLGNSWQP